MSLTQFLFDHEKGWDRNNGAVDEKDRRRLGRPSGVAGVGGGQRSGSWAGVAGTAWTASLSAPHGPAHQFPPSTERSEQSPGWGGQVTELNDIRSFSLSRLSESLLLAPSL